MNREKEKKEQWWTSAMIATGFLFACVSSVASAVVLKNVIGDVKDAVDRVKVSRPLFPSATALGDQMSAAGNVLITAIVFGGLSVLMFCLRYFDPRSWMRTWLSCVASHAHATLAAVAVAMLLSPATEGVFDSSIRIASPDCSRIPVASAVVIGVFSSAAAIASLWDVANAKTAVAKEAEEEEEGARSSLSKEREYRAFVPLRAEQKKKGALSEAAARVFLSPYQ